MSTPEANDILECAYQRILKGTSPIPPQQSDQWLDVILKYSESNKGVLSVCMTLILKKIMSPEQDIRKHQAGMQDGFSARGLDTTHVTPFLRKYKFPYMVAGAGALTRSLEQSAPYDINYPGKITPAVVRNAFLQCADCIQNKNINANDALCYLLNGLVKYRKRNESVKLENPDGLPIVSIVQNIETHFTMASRGGSHLPVLAIYAIYKQMVTEMEKYKNCRLCELQAHNSPDAKSGFLGDVQINDSKGNPIEAVEIKHGIQLTPDLVTACYEKFKTVKSIRTYYLLSTREDLEHMDKIKEIILYIHQNHGCQMIVNGISSTLRYYLRMVNSVDVFMNNYVELVEQECNYDIKMQWKSICEKTHSSAQPNERER